MYQYTAISWRRICEDGTISNLEHVIQDRERAADEIRELALTPGVFALRFVHVGDDPTAPGEPEATAFVTRIGPPVTD